MIVDGHQTGKPRAAGSDPTKPIAGCRFTKFDRLLKRTAFERLGRRAKKVQTRHFIALFEANAIDRCRLGVSASRKVGSAVSRNRIKRLAREYFRQNRHLLGNNLDVHVIAKKEAANVCNQEVMISLEQLFKKIGNFKDD
jgi:ribonuclease P protein component